MYVYNNANYYDKFIYHYIFFFKQIFVFRFNCNKMSHVETLMFRGLLKSYKSSFSTYGTIQLQT